MSFKTVIALFCSFALLNLAAATACTANTGCTDVALGQCDITSASTAATYHTCIACTAALGCDQFTAATVCDTSSSTCVQCTKTADCASNESSFNECLTTVGVCVECLEDSDCTTSTTPYCNGYACSATASAGILKVAGISAAALALGFAF